MRAFGLSCVVCALCVLIAQSVFAHGFEPAVVEVETLDASTLSVRWRPPSSAERGTDQGLRVSLGSACPLRDEHAALADANVVGLSWTASCQLEQAAVSVQGLDAWDVDVFVVVRDRGETRTILLRPGMQAVSLSPTHDGNATQRWLRSFLILGFKHILEGVDHLAFVLGLLLVVHAQRVRLLAVTAFTVGHSMTLALVMFGWINVPAAPAEACIALSVVLVAREAVGQDQASLSARRPWIVSGGFGLVHGLGFAGALQSMGLSRSEVPKALFGFNLGVELGQIAFVLCILLVEQLLFRSERLRHRVRVIAGCCLGVAGAYWTLDRLSAL